MARADWRLFRTRVPEWRDRYLARVNRELAEMLADRDKKPDACFWDTHDRMTREARVLRDCLDGHSQSKMEQYMILMLAHGLIDDDDLTEFSDELQHRVGRWIRPETPPAGSR